MKVEYKIITRRNEQSRFWFAADRLKFLQKHARDGWQYVREDEESTSKHEDDPPEQTLHVLLKRVIA